MQFLKIIIPVLILSIIVIYFLIPKNPSKTSETTKNKESTIPNINDDTSLQTKELVDFAVEALRARKYEGSDLILEQKLSDGSNYEQFIASYKSDDLKIYGLLTIPKEEMPENGFPTIVFNHGYIPPTQYVTTQRYEAYVDNFAKNGFIVFKPDFRGHGKSEGVPLGTYFSAGYSIDILIAVASLKKFEKVDPSRIGMWGHSMSGNLTLRAMLVDSDIKAGVIWAGAVYSYEDFAKYRISDTSYVRRVAPMNNLELPPHISNEISKIREDASSVNFDSDFWKSISLTANLKYLNSPVQIHHSKDDSVVDIGYSYDLVESLKQSNKIHEFYEYRGGGHNISSPYFEQAISRSVEFFKQNL
mgnify:CR=1 FL=1